MTDLRKIVAAIERQKPEIMYGHIFSPELLDSPLELSMYRSLLLGLLVEWASKDERQLMIEPIGAGKYGIFRQGDYGVAAKVCPDLLAAWAWVCGVEVDDE